MQATRPISLEYLKVTEMCIECFDLQFLIPSEISHVQYWFVPSASPMAEWQIQMQTNGFKISLWRAYD